LVVDPGVWISALIGRPGPPDELLQAAAEGRAVVLASPLLLAELREVVNRAKFRRYFTIEEAESFIAALELLAHHVEDPSRDRWVQICPDPDDDYLVALAEVAEATLLVSGPWRHRSLCETTVRSARGRRTARGGRLFPATGAAVPPPSGDRLRTSADQSTGGLSWSGFTPRPRARRRAACRHAGGSTPQARPTAAPTRHRAGPRVGSAARCTPRSAPPPPATAACA
jgi:putative PIN family toxin of toxin-antitoxin system